MDLLNNKQDFFTRKNEIEQVQKQKQEYYLLGRYLRRKGLKIFYYNPIDEQIKELEIKYSDTIHIVNIDGVLTLIDYESQKCVVDNKCIYFECLNLKSALKRFNNYKNGKIKDLCNLIKYDKNNKIKFF